MSVAMSPTPLSRFRGCLLGGAIGDALGAPVEFMSWSEIAAQFGEAGIRDIAPAYGTLGAITDDTQMTLFTAEGLLRAYVRGQVRGISTMTGVTDHAYLRWLETQGRVSPKSVSRDGWLWNIPALHQVRAPGTTCLNALMAKHSFGEPAANDRKGCGGLMRVAPVGLLIWHRHGPDKAQRAFDLAADLAGLTHGHPTGRWPAGVFAVLVLRALDGLSTKQALPEAKTLLRSKEEHCETLAAIEAAEALASSDQTPSPQAIAQLGEGWVAEEALAISIYCALVAESVEHGIVLAVNHDGDSDSTGAITGNLLGALEGEAALPHRWIAKVELREVLEQMALDLYIHPTWNLDDTSAEFDAIWARYPGG